MAWDKDLVLKTRQRQVRVRNSCGIVTYAKTFSWKEEKMKWNWNKEVKRGKKMRNSKR